MKFRCRALAALVSILLPFLTSTGCGTQGAQSPNLVLSTTALTFSSTTVGSTGSSQSLTLTNTGGQPLQLSAYTLSDTADFSLSSPCAPTLAAGATCTLTVSFQPRSAAVLSATLTLTDNTVGIPGAQQVITLSGIGTPMPVAQATFAPSAVDFGQSVLNTASAQQAVSLSNPGAAPLQIASLTLSDPAEFSIASNTCGTTLPAGGSCTFGLLFTPQAVGSQNATLTLTDNAGGQTGSQQILALHGTGLPTPQPKATLSPLDLTFNPTILHTSSPTQAVTLSNTGPSTLQISATTLSDPANFSLASTTCGPSLQPNSTCSLNVTFTPQATGPLSATLALTDNSGGTDGTVQTITLTGTGLPVPVPHLALSSGALTFAPTILKTAAATQSLTLTNTGSAPLVLSNTALSDTTDYTVATNCVATIPVAGSCTLSIGFDPQSPGTLRSALTLTDNDGIPNGTVQQTIMLNGTGLPVPVPQASITPASLTFGSVYLNAVSAAQTFTITNNGTADLDLQSLVLSDTSNFTLTSACGSTLPANASCTVSVVFHPQTAAPLTATITATDNSAGTAGTQQVLTLTGTGLALPKPQATLSTSALQFADTMASLHTAAQTATLTNTGDAPLLIGAISVSDPADFSLQTNCPASLAAGVSCTLTLAFQPQAEQAFKAAVTLQDNSGATDPTATATAQQTLALSGTGLAFAGPRAAITPASLTFPKTITNSTAPPQTVTLTNTGTTPLTVSRLTLTGAAASSFAIANTDCAGALAPSAVCTATLTYTPLLASTADTASLVFTDDSRGAAGPTQSVPLTGSAIQQVNSVENFGDSITCGFYAFPNDGTGLVFSLEGYAGLFDASLGAGIPAHNWCRQGDTAADLARQWVFWNSTPTATDHQLFTLMIGTNDAYRYGIDPSALQTYTQEVAAAIAWLAMPDTDKVLANAITQQTGTWTPDIGFGLKSADPAASLSFTVNQAIAGRNLYVVYHVWAQPSAQAGSATIAVDGTVQATVDESQNSAVRIPTENGTADTFLVQSVPLGDVGQHTVTFTSAGANGSQVGLLWAGVPHANYAQQDAAPRVLLGLVTNSPSGVQTTLASFYNQQLKALVPTLTADGMNITIVPTDYIMNVNTDFADILHPNNAGHARLATAFEQAR